MLRTLRTHARAWLIGLLAGALLVGAAPLAAQADPHMPVNVPAPTPGIGSRDIGTPVSGSIPAASPVKFIDFTVSETGYSVLLGDDGRAYTLGVTTYVDASGSTVPWTTPSLSVAVPAGVSITQLFPGSRDVFGLGSDSEIYRFPMEGGPSVLTTPFTVPVGRTVIDVQSTDYSTHVLLDNGEVWGWGDGVYGLVGDGTKQPHPVPSPMTTFPAGTKIVDLVAGAFHMVALADDGTVYAWGYLSNGLCGCGTTSAVEALVPRSVSMPAGISVATVEAGWASAFALTTSGQLVQWGWDAVGGFATPALLTDGSFSTLRFVSMEAPYSYSASNVAVTADGTLYSWGRDGDSGRLGQGTDDATVTSPLPVAAPMGTHFTKIVTSQYQVLAQDESGQLYGWGYNLGGQIGDGTTTSRNVPVAVSPPTSLLLSAAYDGRPVTGISQTGPNWTGTAPIGLCGVVDASASYVDTGVPGSLNWPAAFDVGPSTAPVVTTPLADVSAPIGSTATLSFSLADPQEAEVTWYVSTDGGANFDQIPDETTPSLRVAVGAGEVRYAAEASNCKGTEIAGMMTLRGVSADQDGPGTGPGSAVGPGGGGIARTGDHHSPLLVGITAGALLLIGAGAVAISATGRRRRAAQR